MTSKAQVLIGDKDETAILRLSAKLASDGYDVIKSSQFSEFSMQVAQNCPDAVLLGQFDDIKQANAAKQIKELTAPRPLPTLLFNASSSKEDRLEAIEAEVQDMLEGVPSDNLLTRRISLLTRLSTMQHELERRVHTASDFDVFIDPWTHDRFADKKSQVLIIGSEGDNVEELKKELVSMDLAIDCENDFYRAADRLDAERFDACIISITNEQAADQALYLSSHLRNNPRQFNMPVIILTKTGMLLNVDAGYRAGATNVIEDCQDLNLVATHCKMLVKGQRMKWSMRDPMIATQTDATTDSLNGVYSKDFFINHLTRQIDDYKQRSSNLSMAIFAIRNAPDVLQRFGQEACDMLLQQMADWIQGLLRIEDMTARVGPYEFAVLLPDTSEKLASMVANRITGILHHSEFRLTDEIMEAINVWVDLGVCGLASGDDAETFLKRTHNSIF
ncbi:diguanylate cyclase [Curvivirga sp.]|uniref:diguanylate cyclase n=1 Tax=Curvivirga sp. TaxID=2856848 RepID=UPI003B5A9D03